MASLFTKIIEGEIPSYKIAEDDKHFAFLDIRPLARGHTLVIPKREEDYIFDLQDQELRDLIIFAKKVARAIDQVIPCQRVGVSVVGLEVPHTHVHLIPINSIGDMNFSKGPITISEAEMREIADNIARLVKV
ncbi:MAG: HIT family protein [Saprospirales bacterium]|nr:MAG: HIT family protein [Saprospirales bacterium]